MLRRQGFILIAVLTGIINPQLHAQTNSNTITIPQPQASTNTLTQSQLPIPEPTPVPTPTPTPTPTPIKAQVTYKSSIKIETPADGALIQKNHVDVFVDHLTPLPRGSQYHVFLDNNPPLILESSAVPCVLKKLEDGGHLLRVFAVDAEGRALPDAYAVSSFYVKRRDFQNFLPPNVPYITVNLPLGGLVVPDEKKQVCFDYIVHGVQLSSSGYKLHCRFNNRQTIIDTPGPVYLPDVSYGKNKLRIELIDPDGNPVMNDFAIVNRDFEVVAAPKPMPVKPNIQRQD
jgi:hypothetical protein